MMTCRNRLSCLFALVSLCVAPLPSWSDRVAEQSKALVNGAGSTLGGSLDTSALSREVHAVLRRSEGASDYPTGHTAAVAAAFMLEAVIQHAQARKADLLADPVWSRGALGGTIGGHWQRLINALQLSCADLRAGEGSQRHYSAWWTGDELRYFDRRLDYKSWLREYSEQAATDALFEMAAREISEMIRCSELARVSLIPVHQSHVADFSAHMDALDGQWRKFFKRMKAETPFETALNTGRYGNSTDAARFARPPVDQIIFLHPSAGYEVTGFEAGDVAPTLLLEVIGYNRLSWTGGTISDWPVGISLAASYALGETDADRLGVGALLHVQSAYSLGAFVRGVGGDNEWVATVNFDLWQLFQGKKDEVAEKLKYVGIRM